MKVVVVVGLAAVSQLDIAQGAPVTLNYTMGTDADGAKDGTTDTMTWTKNVTDFNGTDASFDVVISGAAIGGNWFTSVGTMGIGDNDVDSGEGGMFSVAIANFNAGTSGYVVGNVDFGFVNHTTARDTGATDSGTFTTLNGDTPSSTLTWVDAGGSGSGFTGDNNDGSFDLETMLVTYTDAVAGDRLTSFTHVGAGGDFRFFTTSVEYDYAPIILSGDFADHGGDVNSIPTSGNISAGLGVSSLGVNVLPFLNGAADTFNTNGNWQGYAVVDFRADQLGSGAYIAFDFTTSEPLTITKVTSVVAVGDRDGDVFINNRDMGTGSFDVYEGGTEIGSWGVTYGSPGAGTTISTAGTPINLKADRTYNIRFVNDDGDDSGWFGFKSFKVQGHINLNRPQGTVILIH